MEISSKLNTSHIRRMDYSKRNIDFTDISSIDLVPTPPKEAKPDSTKMRRRHRIRQQTPLEARYECPKQSITKNSQHEYTVCDSGSKVVKDTDYAVTTKSSKEEFNHIRYPAPGPREELVPSAFPINKNRLPPVMAPRKVPLPPKTLATPRPVKAYPLNVFQENLEPSSLLTHVYGCRDNYVHDRVIPVAKLSRPTRHPASTPRNKTLCHRETLVPKLLNKRLPSITAHKTGLPPLCAY